MGGYCLIQTQANPRLNIRISLVHLEKSWLLFDLIYPRVIWPVGLGCETLGLWERVFVAGFAGRYPMLNLMVREFLPSPPPLNPFNFIKVKVSAGSSWVFNIP